MSEIMAQYHDRMIKRSAPLAEIQPAIDAFNAALNEATQASLPHTAINQVFQTIKSTYDSMIGPAMQQAMEVPQGEGGVMVGGGY